MKYCQILLKLSMERRKRWNLLGFILTIPLVMIILGVIYIAPSYANELKVIDRALLIIVIVGVFAIIYKKIKYISNIKK